MVFYANSTMFCLKQEDTWYNAMGTGYFVFKRNHLVYVAEAT